MHTQELVLFLPSIKHAPTWKFNYKKLLHVKNVMFITHYLSSSFKLKWRPGNRCKEDVQLKNASMQ